MDRNLYTDPIDWSDVDAHDLADRAAGALAAVTGVPGHDIAVVLGTGLADAADVLGPTSSRHPLDVLPGLPASFVSHQTSEFRSVDLEGRRVLVFLGRLHLYEGYSPAQVTHVVRTAVRAGCSTVILTNASGSLRPDVQTGSVALVADHLNLTGRSPLAAHPTAPGLPSPFVDLVDAWSPRLRSVAQSVDPTLPECVYAQVGGPHFETPAEIRMLRTMGADLVGMSSVMEAIVARQGGADVLGLSLVTNLAAGMEAEGVSPGDIIDVGRHRAADVGTLVRDVILAL
jgi:purine-nucleoside phosphorylase